MQRYINVPSVGKGLIKRVFLTRYMNFLNAVFNTLPDIVSMKTPLEIKIWRRKCSFIALRRTIFTNLEKNLKTLRIRHIDMAVDILLSLTSFFKYKN